MLAQPDLFPAPKPPRAKPRTMMHVVNAGYIDGLGDAVVMECGRCGHNSDWMREEPGDKRGRACPHCNSQERA